VVLVAGSFPFPAEVVEAAVGSAREVAARSSGRLVVVPAVGSFPFPVEVEVAAAGSARQVAARSSGRLEVVPVGRLRFLPR
jgi:hypothetical protein